MDGVLDRMHDRLPPGVGAKGNDEQNAPAEVAAHRKRKLYLHVQRVVVHHRRVESQHGSQEGGTVGDARSALVHDLDLVAFEHGHVDELARLVARAVLQCQEPGRDDFHDEAEGRNHVRRTPDHQRSRRVAWRRGPRRRTVRPDTEVDTRLLDRRCRVSQCARFEREGLFEDQRMNLLDRSEKRERDLRT